MTTATATEKKFKRFDMQDEKDFAIETLAEMKEWLTDFWSWSNNEDEDMSEEELKKFFVEIENADKDELFEMLAGIDYTFDELDEDGNVIPFEVSKIQTNMSYGYSVVSEIISDTVVIQCLSQEKIIHEEVTTIEQMNEQHEKNVDFVMENYVQMFMKKIQEQIDSRYEAIDELHMDFAICPVEHEAKIESRIKEIIAELTVLEAQKKQYRGVN